MEGNLKVKSSLGTFNVDEAQGIVECFVAAVGNKDSVGDIVVPGAFTASLRRRKPRVVWGHDWNQPIGKVLEIYEVPASDPRLPSKMKAAGVGGLYARVQFNLKSERGREAFHSIVFFGEEQEWSIGYKTLDSIYSQERSANLLKEVELYEVSPVLHGANQLTATISIKSEKQEDKVDSFRKSKWKVFDPDFAEMIRTKHPDIWGKGGNIKGNDQYRALLPIYRKGGKATSEAEINALQLREAWVARHAQDYQLAGVVAQIKWLAVGSRGEGYMKDVIREAIAKKEQKAASGSANAKGVDPSVAELISQLSDLLKDGDGDFDDMLGELVERAGAIHAEMEADEDDEDDHEHMENGPKMTRRILSLPDDQPAKGGCGCGCEGKGACDVSGKSLLDYTGDRPISDLSAKLSALLADTITFYFRAHGFHWNVVGQDFSQYHALFGEIASDAYSAIDPLAENVRKLGAYAPYNLGDFIQLRTVSDASGLGDPRTMANDLLQANVVLLAQLNDAFSAANAANEQGIANFLAERIDMQQKWKWFLSSSVKALPMGAPAPIMVDNPLAEKLGVLLADAYTLYFRVHGYHWNVEGEDFSQYHSLFGEIYEDIYGSVDAIAENIRKIGSIAPFRLVDLVAVRKLNDVALPSGPRGMAADIVQANDVFIGELSSAFDLANSMNEQGIANFIAERLDAHQKWRWFLVSSVRSSEVKSAIDEIEVKAGRVIAGRNMQRLRQALDLLRQVVEEGDPQGAIQMKSAEQPTEYLVIDTTPESMFEVKQYLDDFADFHNAEVVVDEEGGEWAAIEAKNDEMMNVLLDFFEPRQDELQIKGFFYGESTDEVVFDDTVEGK